MELYLWRRERAEIREERMRDGGREGKEERRGGEGEERERDPKVLHWDVMRYMQAIIKKNWQKFMVFIIFALDHQTVLLVAS